MNFRTKQLEKKYGFPQRTAYVFATYSSGIYIYNRLTNSIYNYKHQVTDPTSLGNNTQYSFAVGKKGWVFLVANPNGISYFNRTDFIGTQTVFTDDSGNGYHSFVAGIATSDNNTYYIGTFDGLAVAMVSVKSIREHLKWIILPTPR